jgi:dihydroxyacetone kinase phosphoprotein-dependent L subunit
VVTDDVAAAPPERRGERRGIAGNFCVFKVAGAAAERGDQLDEVTRVAAKANERTRTLGVAFGGCTLPGSDGPLFTVEPGRIEVGMGVHGEPGVRSGERVPAAQLAQLLVAALLDEAERPAGAGDRAVVLVNGLGRTKYEELFVLYRDVSRLLDSAGVAPVAPEVGEFVTSLDMAGCSLTVFWVDDELEALWTAPADSPAYRKPGAVFTPPMGRPHEPVGSGQRAAASVTMPPATARVGHAPVDRVGAGLIRDALASMLKAIEPAEDELGRLDAVAGDGDHGRAMVRGLRAAIAATAASGEVPGELLESAATAFANAAGGASGALWGAMLQSAGRALAEHGTGPEAIGRALNQAVASLEKLGGAKVGDKTMLDALSPFAEAYSDRARAGDGLAVAWSAALGAAQHGASRTAEMVSRRGRSAVLGDRSLGTPDPGAVSMMYCLTAVSQGLSPATNRSTTATPTNGS